MSMYDNSSDSVNREFVHRVSTMWITEMVCFTWRLAVRPPSRRRFASLGDAFAGKKLSNRSFNNARCAATARSWAQVDSGIPDSFDQVIGQRDS